MTKNKDNKKNNRKKERKRTKTYEEEEEKKKKKSLVRCSGDPKLLVSSYQSFKASSKNGLAEISLITVKPRSSKSTYNHSHHHQVFFDKVKKTTFQVPLIMFIKQTW